jgi:DnaJ-domain-containing protein 1
MSKRLKFKFKKTLKKAEFVQADLEYHKELLPEAKNLFIEEIERYLQKLSSEDQQKLRTIREQKAPPTNSKSVEEEPETSCETDPPPYSGCTALVTTDIEYEADPQEKSEKLKTIELKKLFHKIAEQTHPDKVAASGFSPQEVRRLERVFKKALDAYTNNNWYLLYAIALNLELETPELGDYHVAWVEDDIRRTLGSIARISNMISWIWYTGDKGIKELAIKDFFRQIYNYDYTDF